MKKIITFLCLLLLSLNGHGQGTGVEIPVMSPETASLGKFGAYPVSYYTGQPDISIPLYRLDVHGLSIPIALRYDPSGFMPNKDSGKVGHDWSLVAGGIITRSVNLMPDEYSGNSFNPPYQNPRGHWYAIKQQGRRLDEDSVRTLKYITTSASAQIDSETTPDLFTFSFGEHHGQFVIAHDGTPKVIGDGNYRVDLSGFACQSLTGFTASSSIVITTDDGTKYTFGGSLASLELSLHMRRENGNLMENTENGIINAFHLTRIEKPDGTTVEFDYKTYSSQAYRYVDEDNIVKNKYYADMCSSAYGMSNTLWATNGEALEPSYTFTKVAYLSAIRSAAGNVTFHYTTKEHPFCSGDSYWRKKPLRLDHILVENSLGETVKGIRLCHSYSVAKDGTSYRMFLTDVLCGKEKYSFEYTDTDNLPRPETRGIDLRGYYNGKDGNSSLLPLRYGNSPDDVDFSHRQPDPAYSTKAMLKRITYPTGGYTEFTFEPHRYGTRIRRIKGQFFPHEFEESGMVGGLRICEIKNVPGETRTFEYESSTGGTGENTSSGVFSDLKTYAILNHFAHIGWGITTWFISEGNNVVHANSFSESDIVYSEVTERRGAGNGKTVYEYSTYLDAPDLPCLGEGTYSYYNESATTSDRINLMQYMFAYTSQHIKRGKLLKMSEYAEGSSSPKRRTTYTYSMEGDAGSQAVYAAEVRLLITSRYGVANSQAFYYYPYRLNTEIMEEFEGSQCLIRRKEYSYNAANKLLSEVRTTNSDGTVHRTTYNYPTDYPSDGVCAAMTQKFMVSPVIYERSYAGDLLLKTRHTRYALFCNKFYAPGLVEESRGSGAFHTLVEYHAYDRFGNLLSFTENGRPTEVWLWGYHSLFPIARLVGTTLNAVYGVVPSYTIDALSALTDPGALGNTTLGTLASNIPTAQVTTYKHRPLVGLVHTGHPNGLAQDYTYDAFGRLRSVSTDGDKRQEYTYHHTHVSASPLSAVFGDISPSYKQGEHSFSMQVSGGSGVYGHNWCLTASDGTVVASSNDLTLVHTFNQSGSYTLACTVTDLVTREQVTKQRTFTIGLYRIAFSEITETSSPSTGDVTVTAAIYCNVPTTVSFRLDYRVGATLPETHYECRIGNYFESNSGRGEKEFAVSLPAGKTNVSLSLRNIIVAAEMELFIESVTGDNNEIGYPSSLAIYF